MAMSREEAGKKGGQTAQQNKTEKANSKPAKKATETRKKEPKASTKKGEKDEKARSGHTEKATENTVKTPAKRKVSKKDTLLSAIDILEKDHEEIIIVMEELEGMLSAEEADYDATFQKFKQLFKEHDTAEDEVVYPKLKEYEELRKLILKGYQAHNVVQAGILQLRLWPYATETWGAKFGVVKDCILTHIEEEKQVFSLAAKLCSAEELHEMAEAIREMRS